MEDIEIIEEFSYKIMLKIDNILGVHLSGLSEAKWDELQGEIDEVLKEMYRKVKE